MKLVIIAVLILLCAYSLAVVAPAMAPLLKHLAVRFGFPRPRAVDVEEEEEPACSHGAAMTGGAQCPLCSPDRALPDSSPAPSAVVPPSPGTQEAANGSPADRVLIESTPWLLARWAEAERERAHGESGRFSSWHFDAPTEQQLRQLGDAGLTLRLSSLTRGQVADILGLFEPAEPEDRDILRFFNVPLQGMSRSRARHEVAQLLAHPKNLQAWSERPADVLQGEFFRCFGLPMPGGLTALDAEALIRDHRAKIADEGSSALLDDWDAFESICVALLDPDACEVYDLGRPDLAAIRSAVDALRREGRALPDLAGDRRLVAEKIAELNPELRRPRD